MPAEDQITTFIQKVKDHFVQGRLIKITLGKPPNKQQDLKNLYIRPVEIKDQMLLQAVFRYQTRDVTKNQTLEQTEELLRDHLGRQFLQANLFALNEDVQLMISKKGKAKLISGRPTQSPLQEFSHDHEKTRPLKPEGKIWLQKLGITNASFEVIPRMQDKYRQINKYIEIIDDILPRKTGSDKFTVVDMGSGKGYLTFALYDYLVNHKKIAAQVTGVEIRQDLVELCRDIAKESGFDKLHFESGSIRDFDPGKPDMLIALHACDTATDEAIFKGINSGSPVIIVSPCCQKQVRKAMKPENELKPVLQFGTFLERQAEILTDGLRSLFLEKYGYQTRVLEFISTEHTPKNVMIIAVKSHRNVDKAEISRQIKMIKESFGIEYHHLETLLKDN